MYPCKNKTFSTVQKTVVVLLINLLLFGQILAQTAAPAKSVLSAGEKSLAEKITVQTIKDITTRLSADEMEGRGTMQPGGDKAAQWIADRFKQLGLKPLGDTGSYLQKVAFKETAPLPETLMTVGEEKLAFGTDYGFVPLNSGDKEASGELVFMGYGIPQQPTTPPTGQDANDLTGKVVVILQGPPAKVDKKDWGEEKDQAIFLNLVMKRAAAIVFIGHGREEHSPDEAIGYFVRRQLNLADDPALPAFIPPVVFVSKAGAEKLFSKSGTTVKAALDQAEESNFKPIKLNQTSKIAAKYKTTNGFSNNVVGYIEGSDPALKTEAVLFSAHYDAYGVENGKIYHGAADNALGTAEMLAVAEAFSKTAAKPKRSLIFLAVTGEEYGLYGSKYWSKNPTWDIKKVSANLNLDGMGTEIYGPVKTMVGYGAEHSTLGTLLEDVSATMGIKVVPDPVPDEKVFTRSDHYSFVERGVPALMLMGAPEGDIQVSMKRMKEWEKTDYHQPGDTIKPDWVWEGPETVAEVMGIMGLRLANGATMPTWLSTSRFGKLERGNTTELPKEQ
jgi:hypothetical protein